MRVSLGCPDLTSRRAFPHLLLSLLSQSRHQQYGAPTKLLKYLSFTIGLYRSLVVALLLPAGVAGLVHALEAVRSSATVS